VLFFKISVGLLTVGFFKGGIEVHDSLRVASLGWKQFGSGIGDGKKLIRDNKNFLAVVKVTDENSRPYPVPVQKRERKNTVTITGKAGKSHLKK
jgi:hypothetical protein